MSDDTLISIRDVGFSYGGQPVLEGITFDVHRGEYVGIIGPNGAGKSTLLQIMLGLLGHYTGEITVLGSPPSEMRDRWRVGYVPQKISQMDMRFPITVREVVSQGRVAHAGFLRRLSAADRAAVGRAMEVTEVTDLGGRLIGDLSGGQRQRVFIARALAAEPSILILDEPAISIDPPSQEHLYHLLSQLNKEDALTILFVSHDIDVMMHEASDIICINRNMVCHTPPSSVTERNLKELFGENMKVIHHRH